MKNVSSSVGNGVSSLWSHATGNAPDEASQEASQEVGEQTETVTEAVPEATPEPVVETTPEPQPQPVVEAPAAAEPVVEAAPEPALPPGGPMVFDDVPSASPAPATPTPPANPETYEVLVPEGTYQFLPRQLSIYEGDTVIWRNASGLVHLFATIPGSDPSGTMEIEPTDLLLGGQYQHTFTTAGSYPYFCFIHNRMTGKIVVLPR